ncbi:MAG TPA: DNA repair protein RadC [Candidatus Tectomicrobia bacterium]|jgi:DNA repair protein RadC
MNSVSYSQRIKDWPEDERPRERLLAAGESALSEAQLLAILLRTGDHTSGATAVDLARRLLTTFGESLEAMHAATVAELCQVPGIGMAKACEIKAAFELGRRLLVRQGGPLTQFRSSKDVANYYIPLLTDKKREQFQVILLDRKNRVMRHVMVSQGSLTASVVHPREVFNPAIRDSAAAVIFVHNHPSGDPQPSQEDRTLTARLAEAGKLLGIQVLDHIIVGRDTYMSFADEGLLDGRR